MEKPTKKVPYTQQKEEERVSTAPSTNKNRMVVEISKVHNLQLPAVRGKVMTREGKRVKKQEHRDHQYEEGHKRPQTSKGSRGARFHESQFYQQDGDDLIMTTKQEKIEIFKKKVQDNSVNSKH